jgi:hypothetical protein
MGLYPRACRWIGPRLCKVASRADPPSWGGGEATLLIGVIFPTNHLSTAVPEPGRTRRNRLPAPVEAFPVDPDAQTCVSAPAMLTDLCRRSIVDAGDKSHLGNLGLEPCR